MSRTARQRRRRRREDFDERLHAAAGYTGLVGLLAGVSGCMALGVERSLDGRTAA